MRRLAAFVAGGSLLCAAAPVRAAVEAPVHVPTVTVELPAGSPQVDPLPSVAGVEVPVKVTRASPASAPSGGGSADTGSAAGSQAGSSAPAARRRQPSSAANGPATTRSGGPSASVRRARAAGARGRVRARRGVRRRPRPAQHRVEPRQPRAESVFGRVPLPLPVPDWSKPIILGLLLVAVWLGIRSRMAARRARRLDAQRLALTQDLALLQSTLVPDVPDRVGELKVSVAYRPADGPAGGGDFYDLVELGGGRVGIIVGDASGHGRDALARATLTRYTLRAYVQAGLEPRGALKLAGQVLAGDGEQFTTVVIAVHDPASGTLTYASAGHPPPIVVDAPMGEPPAGWTCPPIGWGVPTGRVQTTISMPSRARACFYSDGLTEARAQGAMLGREGLSEILTSLESAPTAAEVLERVRATADGVSDDMAVCIVQAISGSESPFWMEDLELDARQVTGPRTHHLLRKRRVPRDQIADVIVRARRIVEEHGTALLRLRFEPGRVTATVASPDEFAEPMRGAHPAVPANGRSDAQALALARIATG